MSVCGVCVACDRDVYTAENKVVADDSVFHGACYRCCMCKRVLPEGGGFLEDRHLYCAFHFKKLRPGSTDQLPASEQLLGRARARTTNAMSMASLTEKDFDVSSVSEVDRLKSEVSVLRQTCERLRATHAEELQAMQRLHEDTATALMVGEASSGNEADILKNEVDRLKSEVSVLHDTCERLRATHAEELQAMQRLHEDTATALRMAARKYRALARRLARENEALSMHLTGARAEGGDSSSSDGLLVRRRGTWSSSDGLKEDGHHLGDGGVADEAETHSAEGRGGKMLKKFRRRNGKPRISQPKDFRHLESGTSTVMGGMMATKGADHDATMARLMEGGEFWKHGHRGKPHRRWVRVLAKERKIVWGPERGKEDSKAFIHFDEYRGVVLPTGPGKKKGADTRFSVSGSSRSLDLECDNEAERSEWIHCFNILLESVADKVEHSLEVLQQRPTPEGLDPRRLEQYLSDKDFMQTFKMNKASFQGLASWRQANLKKQARLF